MRKPFFMKLAGALGLCAALLATSCGGGGGDPGTPLLPPTSKLIMRPNLSGLTMTVGQSSEPVTITGGQAPYYTGSTGGVIPKILDDGTLYIQAVAPTVDAGSTCKSASGDSGSDYVWVQDSSYQQNQIKFSICVDARPTYPAASLSSTLGDTTAIALAPGGAQSFTVYDGTAPYTAVSSDPSVASVSPSSGNGAVTVTAGTATGSNLITITDATGISLVVTVQNSGAAPALNVLPPAITNVASRSVTLSVVGGVAPYTVYSSAPNIATIANIANSSGGTSVLVNLLTAGSAVITVKDAANTVKTVTVTVTEPPAAVFSVDPSIQLLPEGSVAPITFTLSNGIGPYYVTWPTTVGGVPTSSLIGGVSTIVSSGSLSVSLTASCIKSDKVIPLTVTDTANGNTAMATVFIVDSNKANDNTPGCL